MLGRSRSVRSWKAGSSAKWRARAIRVFARATTCSAGLAGSSTAPSPAPACSREIRSPRGSRAKVVRGPGSPLSHNQFVRLDIETPVWQRHAIRVVHRRRPRLEDERQQLGEVLTPIVKIGETVPTKDSLADPIPSP